jgi:hypothetical protein
MGEVFAKLSNYSLFLRPDQFYRYRTVEVSKTGLLTLHRAHSLGGDSVTEGWLKPDFVQEIWVRPMSSSATSTSSQSESCMGR